jgi:WhiB family redox-sensing transcriptional regulator
MQLQGICAPKTGPVNDWRDLGACLKQDPELFFPVGSDAAALAQVEQARAVCTGCPVAGRCLSWSLTTRQSAGVWGGLSESERLSVLRNRARLTQRAGVTTVAARRAVVS